VRDPAATSVQVLRAELDAAARLPRTQARAMSGAFYSSPAFLELEREELFRRQWVCVGHAGALPSVGDYFTTELVGEPLLIVRDSPTRIRVLPNVCRHIEPYIRNYHPAEQHFLYEAEEVWNTNWKCLVENFMEGYHLSPLTADTLAVRWGLTGIENDSEAPVVQDYLRLCKAFCDEDRLQLERLTPGLKSRAFVPGPLAPDDFEGTIWDIWQYIARRLGASAADPIPPS
jgi:hypothetical protein